MGRFYRRNRSGYGNAGPGYASYCGREDCRSIGAQQAEAQGRYPLTRAIRRVAAQAGCTHREARAALLATYSGEWHHTGNRARRTEYYDVNAAVQRIQQDRDQQMPSDAAIARAVAFGDMLR
jgi:hypothetical protein